MCIRDRSSEQGDDPAAPRVHRQYFNHRHHKGAPVSRTARIERATAESTVLVELDLDGSGRAASDTGVPFFDHMVSQLGRHGGFDLAVRTRGDLAVDAHHTVEDTAIAIGTALRQALGGKTGIRRFGDAPVSYIHLRAHETV